MPDSHFTPRIGKVPTSLYRPRLSEAEFTCAWMAIDLRIRSLSLSLVRGDRAEADDLYQSVFERTFRARRQFTPGTSFVAWIVTCTVNTHLAQLRKKKDLRVADLVNSANRERKNDHTLLDHLSRTHTMPNAEHHLELLDTLRAIAGLPYDQAMAVCLAASELSYDDMAAALGIPPGTAKSRVSRGRAELARRLDPERPSRNVRLARPAPDNEDPK